MLDADLVRLARAIHGHIVPSIESHGSVGEGPSLLVYVMEQLPGVTYMEACLAHNVHTVFSSEQYERQRNTIMDFARYEILYPLLVLQNTILTVYQGSSLLPGMLPKSLI